MRRRSRILWVSVCILAFFLSLTLPQMAQSAPQFGPWVGQAQVGEKLKVSMTLLGLLKNTQSQLKATCMESWAESEGDELNTLQTRIPLTLDYEKTLDRGGLITLTSNELIKDPVVRVHVASNCPLVTFVQTWDLQLDFPILSQTKNKQLNETTGAYGFSGGASTPTSFSLSGSPTLAASFRKPIFKAETIAQTPQPMPVVVSPQQNEPQAQLENMAMSKPSIQVHEQIRDQAQEHAASLTHPSTSGWSKDPALSGDEMNLIPFVLFGGISMLIIAFGMWWGQRHSRSADVIASNGNSHKLGFERLFPKTKLTKLEPKVPSGESSSPNKAKEVEVNVAAFSKQLFDSFLGGSQSPDDSNENYSSRSTKSPKVNSQEAKSLVTKVASSQNLSPKPWKVPEPFLSLLPASSVRDWSAFQATEASLRCEMALIELAYLTAQQGEMVYDIQIAEVLDVMESQKAYENSNQTIQAPSDLIKDFVRSRVCELDSKQCIDKFIESLQTMNSSEYCKKFSMADGLWLEFISDLDIR